MYRKGPYKLIALPTGPDREKYRYELYHVDNDPWEMHDLAGQPAMAATFQTLQEELSSLWQKQKTRLPDRLEPPMPRSRYRITWPADPWKPVEPVDTPQPQTSRPKRPV